MGLQFSKKRFVGTSHLADNHKENVCQTKRFYDRLQKRNEIISQQQKSKLAIFGGLI